MVCRMSKKGGRHVEGYIDVGRGQREESSELCKKQEVYRVHPVIWLDYGQANASSADNLSDTDRVGMDCSSDDC
jgi:hypothetical protein